MDRDSSRNAGAPVAGRARTPSDLRRIVHEVLRRVPHGRVVTYGQLALLAGRPRAAREVGWIAHQGGARLPWHRVVNRFGGLAAGYHNGRAGHKRDLAAEGVRVRRDLTVDLRRYQWWPDGALSRRLGLTLETLAAMSVAQRGLRPRRPPRAKNTLGRATARPNTPSTQRFDLMRRARPSLV